MTATEGKVKVVNPPLHPQDLYWGEIIPSLHFFHKCFDLQLQRQSFMSPIRMPSGNLKFSACVIS